MSSEPMDPEKALFHLFGADVAEAFAANTPVPSVDVAVASDSADLPRFAWHVLQADTDALMQTIGAEAVDALEDVAKYHTPTVQDTGRWSMMDRETRANLSHEEKLDAIRQDEKARRRQEEKDRQAEREALSSVTPYDALTREERAGLSLDEKVRAIKAQSLRASQDA
ncbi:hypothetical protein [Longibacter salinarum]|nr:hypothetical protein [Longibacter salinarum]